MTDPARDDLERDAHREQNPCVHFWRVIECNGGDTDVVECPRCGQQKQVRCNFDEEYS